MTTSRPVTGPGGRRTPVVGAQRGPVEPRVDLAPPTIEPACPPDDACPADGSVATTGAGGAASIEEGELRLEIPRWVRRLTALCALALVPWIVYLALVLPKHARASHYDIAWVGFDAAMCLALGALAFSAARRRPSTGPLAAVTATLLVVDAWFDVITSSNQSQFTTALLSAVLIELPLAALCAWVSLNAERLRTRAVRRLWERAEYASRAARRLAAMQRRDNWRRVRHLPPR